jgi:signal peptidase I
MAKRKNRHQYEQSLPKLPSQTEQPTKTKNPQSFRETVESIVIAFVLAFLFRTFEAEAFVIPTGSMAPTLMGRHKDVFCTDCGQRFQVNTSGEDKETVSALFRSGQIRSPGEAKCVAGKCPECRYNMPMQPDLPHDLREDSLTQPIQNQTSYNGDRILVNKYIYAFSEPARWDVVVFKYPGNGQMNYIKRLVGLPEETLRVYQGDLFVGPKDATLDTEFAIERKPPKKVWAMRQFVHNTNDDPAVLYDLGWPLRWNIWPADEVQSSAWKIEREADGATVRQRFIANPTNTKTSWIRYQHFTPSYAAWQRAFDLRRKGGKFSPTNDLEMRPQLITDFNSYNTTVHYWEAKKNDSLQINPRHFDYHWVGDLLIEVDVDIKAPQGELILDLVEAGRHFSCRIDLSNGNVTLAVEGQADFAPQASTQLNRTGNHKLLFANVDDQLLLWIDRKLVQFDAGSQYDADTVFGNRREMRPQTSANDPGDLAPAGVGVVDADLEITHLELSRDIYYIASDYRYSNSLVTDASEMNPYNRSRYLYDPSTWDLFLERRSVDFPLGKDQFFVMGDNSSESLDARLWRGGNARNPGHPGGSYLERRLLIGKALCVYWPHSWNRIPGTRIPFPLFPNFADMRLVR